MNPLTFARSIPVLAFGVLSHALAAQAPPVQFGSSFYEYVPANNLTWQNAITSSALRSFLGVPGHLVTITSAAENAFLAANFAGHPGFVGAWIAGQVDGNVTGRWMAGPETGLVFSQGQTPVGGAYATWGGIEPNNAPSFAWMNIGQPFAGIGTGQWADDDNGVPSGADPVIGYLVEYESPPWRSFGTGCIGSGGIPNLRATTAPVRGQAFALDVSGLPPAPGAYVMVLGFSDSVLPGAGALPLELAALGAPTCFVLCDLVFTEPRAHGGSADGYSIGLPNQPGLAGLVFFQQAYVLDAPANLLGLTTSNGGRAVIQ